MTPLPLLEKLSAAANSTLTKDQMLVLFNRQTAEDIRVAKDLKRMSGALMESVRRRCGYISKLEVVRTLSVAI